jgi:hypothetical protein
MTEPAKTPPTAVSAEELAQLRRFARLSLAEKVRWLEEAHRLVRQLGARKPPREALKP